MGKLILQNALDPIRPIHIINMKGGKNLRKEFYKVSIIGICILCLVTLGVAYAQQKKVGGGDIKYEGAGSNVGPVIFSHETHVNQHKLKCTDCHPKMFKVKKSDIKMTQADFAEGKYCGACHDGKKAFSAVAQADCAKCHKK
jgi:c(7)-type cytochrome triheme protein